MSSGRETSRFWTYAILVIAVFVCYGNVYGNSFLYDDEFLIQKNANIRTWAGVIKSFQMSSTGGAGQVDSFYRPIQGVLYTVVYQIFGESTFGFHLLNIALHALNVVLVFVLGLRLGFGRGVAWLAALLWGLHPVHTEAVVYQSATADTLYTAFTLSSLILIFPRRTVIRVLGALILFVGGLFSKESAIVVPALLVACIFLLSERRWAWRSYVWTWPFWALAIAYLIARKTFLNFDDTFHFYKTSNIYTEHFFYRVYTFLATLPAYVSLLVWPVDLRMDRNFPVYADFASWQVILGALILAAGFAFIWRERGRPRPTISFVFLWFLAAYAPHMGVLVAVNSFFLEHWLYLCSIGLSLGMGEWFAARVWIPYRLQQAVWLGSALVLACVTFQQNRIWATPLSFYSQILKFDSRSGRALNNLAMAMTDAGRDAEAIALYERAIQVSDQYPQTHHNLALALLRTGHVDQAIIHLQRALEIDKDFYHSSNILAQIFHQMGDEAKAQEYSRKFAESAQKFRH